MAFLEINNFDFGNSLLNYIYSINYLIKNNLNDFQITFRKNSLKNYHLIMFKICIPNQKV
jgi:hypothetical protein